MTETRGDRILDAIYDEVDHRLNPDGEECPDCGGEGVTHDCFDGLCVDAESGCEDCETPCATCKSAERARKRAVLEAVVETGDVEVATAWLKQQGRWRDGTTDDEVRAELTKAAEVLAKKKERTA